MPGQRWFSAGDRSKEKSEEESNRDKIWALAKLPYRVVQPPTLSQKKALIEEAAKALGCPPNSPDLPPTLPPTVLTLIKAAEECMLRCKAVVFFGDPLAKCATPPKASHK